jgi:ABC-2 type transport system ATP-binding protein
MHAIEVSRLTKLYGDFAAVRDLSFSVGQGRIAGLVGPNGAGKTTTLRAIAGIHPPSRGTIVVCGFNMAVDPIEAKRRLSFMPDEPKLFDYLSVEEHLRFISRIYGTQGWKGRAAELLDELELTHKRKSLPSELSRGMKQKLVIACGLIHQPDVLIFDEPLTGLDPLGIRRMKNTIVRRAGEGAAVILSSHLIHLVEELCDSVVILHQGRKLAEGSVPELKRKIAEADGVTLEETFLRITSGGGDAGAER